MKAIDLQKIQTKPYLFKYSCVLFSVKLGLNLSPTRQIVLKN